MRSLVLATSAALTLILLPGPLAGQYDPPGDQPPGGGGGPCTGDNLVRVRDNFFDPQTLTIQAGDTVTWCWDGPSMLHNVVEDGGAFRCANGCDHSGGNGNPASGWKFSLTFPDAATVDYYCEVHGGPGGLLMAGRIVVEGGGGGDDGGGDDGGGGGDDGGGGGDDGGGDGGGDDGGGDTGPGSLSFGSFAFAGAEDGGDVVLEVVRRGGTTGAVSVDFETSAGSATAGGDYQAQTGTVNLPGGTARGTLSIPLVDDGTLEDVESFGVTLSSPGGGATLGDPRTATVLVFDDDHPPVTLTADEILCDGFRLATLLDRLSLATPNTSKPVGVNVTFTRLGDFAGLAYTGNGPGTAEHHLAFSTNPEETTLLRNPQRPQLFALSMTRNQTNSDLVPPGAADVLRLFLNPTLDDTPDPFTLLEINDLGDPVTRQGGTPAESKPGRGLADAVRPCHGPLTERDQHVFQVLAKIARVSADGAAAVGIAIFRGGEPDTFRIDAYPLDGSGAPMGRLAAELEVEFGPGDRLDGGTLSVLGRCGPAQSASCTSVTGFTELQLVEPKFSGEFWNDSPYAVSTSGVEGDGEPTSSVDFAALLEGTSWRRPL